MVPVLQFRVDSRGPKFLESKFNRESETLNNTLQNPISN